jgi:hypothetical protein
MPVPEKHAWCRRLAAMAGSEPADFLGYAPPRFLAVLVFRLRDMRAKHNEEERGQVKMTAASSWEVCLRRNWQLEHPKMDVILGFSSHVLF